MHVWPLACRYLRALWLHELLKLKMVACVFLVVSNILGGSALAQIYLNNSKSINPSFDILKDVLLVYFEKIKKKLSTGVLIMQLLLDLHIGRNIFKSLSQMAAWYKQIFLLLFIRISGNIFQL